MNEMETERERAASPEETDQLSRSTKKKRVGDSASGRDDVAAMDVSSPRAPLAAPTVNVVSYRDTLQRNNPNLTFETRDNPIWLADPHEEDSDDDVPVEEDDPLCPTILLTAAEKKALREPW